MLTVANKTDTRMLSITVTSDDAKTFLCSGRCHYRCGSGSDGEHHTDRSAYHCRTSGSRICAGRQRHDEKLAMGIVLGIFLVGMVLTIRFIMNDKIQTEEDIEDYLETSVLAVIPVDKELAYYSKQEEKTEKERHRSHKKRKKS